MKNHLTPEEEKLMYEVRDEWINRFNSLPRINVEKLERGINWLYQLSGFEKPTIYIVPDPLSAQYLKEKIVRNTVWNTVGNKVEYTVRNKVGNTVWNTVWNKVENTVRNKVWSTVGNTVGNTVENTVRNKVWSTVGNITFDLFSFYGGVFLFGWIAFYDFFTRIGIISNNEINSFIDYLQSNAFMCLYYENAVIVVENPVSIYRDNNENLHRTDGYAIEFSNGLGIHYIHGREVPAKYFEKLTKEDFINETNEDYRAAMFEILGEQGVLNLLEAEVVDQQEMVYDVVARPLSLTNQVDEVLDYPTHKEKEILTLLKTKEIFRELDNQPLAWVKYICPSTGSNYLISCEPHHTSAVEAAKSLTDFDWEENESYHWNARS